jgi:hypothetical protein
MRGASTASCSAIPWSMTLMMISSTVEMMRDPPGVPTTNTGLPSLSRIVGVMELNGRLPGAIAFALPCTRPNRFAAPGFAVKSSISSFNRKPVLPAMTLAPKSSLMV